MLTAEVLDLTDEQVARFWSRVDKSAGEHGCWLWDGPPHLGYGQFCWKRHGRQYNRRPHRIAYVLTHGPIPSGWATEEGWFTLDHNTCENKMCVNPEHMLLGPHGDNVRAASRGNARKTHCPRNHEYTEANTYRRQRITGPTRECKTCVRLRRSAQAA